MRSVAIQPNLLQWARLRANLAITDLAKRFPKLEAWERGAAQPTFKQVENFAKATHVPLGYLFLPNPPEETIPIPDFRTVNNREIKRLSPELLETIYTMQRRQAWLRESLMEVGAEPLDFVGNANLNHQPEAVGREMRRTIGFEDGWAAKARTWEEAVGELRRAIEQLGVTAVINGVLGNNTHRKLDVDEFRGFALCDSHAPLIFVNGADAKSAQMFTLAHELAHIWLGAEGEGLSGFKDIFPESTRVEKFCDKAAAEFLLPQRELKSIWREVKDESQPFHILARKFKVSPIVAGRRAMDLRLIDRSAFFEFYNTYINQERTKKKDSGGGDFYSNQNNRIGEKFAAHVIRAAKEGRISFKAAYELTGLNGGAFQEYASRLGFDLP